MVVVKLFWAACIIHYASSSALNPSLGITGGHNISIHEAPFMASLVRAMEKLPNNMVVNHICGGSIIHERFILTAAHCVQGDSFQDTIRVGSSHVYTGGSTYEVEKFIAHDNFTKDDDFTYDVALVKLKKNIQFNTTISKVNLPDGNMKIVPDTLVNVTGFGKIGPRGAVSKYLKQVSVKIRPINDCTIYPWISENDICVWSFHKGSCKGDSGGPMTLGNVQIGIVSNGLACGYMPSIYANVVFLLPWIKENINQNL